jgi:adenylate cyclase
MKTTKKVPQWTIPLGAVVVVGFLVLTGATRSLELKLLDLYTRVVPPPVERPEVVLIDVDDLAMQRVGQWPWSRDLHSRYLADLRALGADSLSFDVEFVDRGPVGVTSRERDAAMAAKSAELDDVFKALGARQIKTSDAADYAKTILQEGILLTARDNDSYLGNAIKVFGKAFTTLNYFLQNNNDDAKAARSYLEEHAAIGPVTGRLDSVKEVLKVDDLRGAIVPIASGAAGAAVTNVTQDKADGTLRRINLLFKTRGSDKVYGQMAFVPVWFRLGKPAIEVVPGRIVLKTSALKDNPQPDIVIPTDPSGAMIINWPHKLYQASFRHVRISDLQDFETAWEELKRQVVAMQRAGYLATDFEAQVLQYETDRAASLVAGDQAAFDAAEKEGADWRASVTDLAGGSRESELVASLRAQAADPKIPKAAKDKIPGLIEDVGVTFSKLGKNLKAYTDFRASLESRLKGAMTFYGWTAVTTTDIGVNPFDPVYYNVGTHASVANTILARSFLNEAPPWISLVIGALLSLVLWFVLGKMKTLPGVSVGFASFVALMAAIGAFYAATGIFPGALGPGLTVFLTVLGLTLMKFWGSEAEKRYIRGAFSTYLSPDVIKELEADPDKLKLGGEKKLMTAMFTDVKGFSTISESLDPNELVTLLNQYLTSMSDIILDAAGTIDKYEGDAIIAFWGAPLHSDRHAQSAVESALLMKKAETAMNERFAREKLHPGPLLTRIGINTGDMTVGNMGTERRMNYTMMGNAVNLAARLEGVNKQYGTWMLTSQATREALDDTIVLRKLDKVAVVGIRLPVRLFEIVCPRAEATDAVLEKISVFEKGIDAYETRDWDGAQRLFERALAIDSVDGPAKTFVERTAQSRVAGFGADWDGVYRLTTK